MKLGYKLMDEVFACPGRSVDYIVTLYWDVMKGVRCSLRDGQVWLRIGDYVDTRMAILVESSLTSSIGDLP